MTKVEFKNVHNKHFPLGVITFAEEERTQEMEEMGFQKIEKKEETPNDKWTEKQIKDWLLKNYPGIKYDINKEKKVYKLEELKKLGLI